MHQFSGFVEGLGLGVQGLGVVAFGHIRNKMQLSISDPGACQGPSSKIRSTLSTAGSCACDVSGSWAVVPDHIMEVAIDEGEFLHPNHTKYEPCFDHVKIRGS